MSKAVTIKIIDLAAKVDRNYSEALDHEVDSRWWAAAVAAQDAAHAAEALAAEANRLREDFIYYATKMKANADKAGQ